MEVKVPNRILMIWHGKICSSAELICTKAQVGLTRWTCPNCGAEFEDRAPEVPDEV